MPEKINWSLNVQIEGGPKAIKNDSLAVEAYDKIRVLVVAGAIDKEIALQPVVGQVKFLIITSDKYDETLAYKVNDSATPVREANLDGPQMFIGKGAVSLLHPEPERFFFTNGLTEDAEIEIIIGRDATT